MSPWTTRPLLCCLVLACAFPISAQVPAKPRVLFLLAEGFNREEFFTPHGIIAAAGYQVDIAAPARGTVVMRPGKPADTDPVAELSLDDVRVEHYVGLVIPGGYSPGNLEKHPRSMEICKEFAAAGKPIAAICHGPRLLVRAGLLRDRVATHLWSVNDELADAWREGSVRGYVDQAVVIDGPYLTSRYPMDAKPFAEEAVRHFARARGVAVAPTTQPSGDVCIKLKADFDAPTYAAVDAALRAEGMLPLAVSDAGGWLRGKGGMVVFTLAGAKPGGMVDLTGESLLGDVPESVRLAAKRVHDVDEGPYTAAIALADGFDDRVAAGMLGVLRARGHRVALVAAQAGPVRGWQGTTLKAQFGYTDKIAWPKGMVVVAPGGLWPTHDPNARQAEQPQWVVDQAPREQERIDWMLARYDEDGMLATFGFDGLRIGRLPRFRGHSFAASEQTLWSFGRDGGKFSKERLVQTADRIISARGSDEIGLVARALPASMAAGQSGGALSSAASAPAVDAALRIVCFGDSITGERPGKPYAHQYLKYSDLLQLLLEARLGDGRAVVINSGWGGDTTYEKKAQGMPGALGRLEKDVLAHRPHIVIILIGGNDSRKTADDQAVTRGNLEALARRVKDSGAKVLMLQYHPALAAPENQSKAWHHLDDNNGQIAEAAAAAGVELLDMAPAMLGAAERYPRAELLNSTDGVHLAPRGEIVYAVTLYRHLLKLGWLDIAR